MDTTNTETVTGRELRKDDLLMVEVDGISTVAVVTSHRLISINQARSMGLSRFHSWNVVSITGWGQGLEVNDVDRFERINA